MPACHQLAVSLTRIQAIGGGFAVAVGIFSMNSIGQSSSDFVRFGGILFQDSLVVFNNSRLTNCTAESLSDNALGTSYVFGGAFAMIHLHQVSNFRLGLLLPSDRPQLTNGYNVTVLVTRSHFTLCSVLSSAAARLGETSGSGGAIHVQSVALTNFSVLDSVFISNRATVAGGATNSPSFSRGGALAVEGNSSFSFVAVSSSKFFNCAVQGANISNMGARGGAVHVLRAASIAVIQTNFTNCSVLNAVSSGVVSGGSAMCTVLSGDTCINKCVFDATAGEDSSETSNGLLVLARSTSLARLNVSHCVFMSSTVVISIICAGSDGALRAVGSCDGPKMLLTQSRILQVSSSTVPSLNVVGSVLMSFPNLQSVSFSGSYLYCALSRFTAFKEQTVASSTSSSVYSCKPCLPHHMSLTANAVSLEELSSSKNADRCFPVSSKLGTSGCPFAVSDCTTYVNVVIGFWTNFSDARTLQDVRRCPQGYCGCINSIDGSCQLTPLLSIGRSTDPLCIRNRTGKLCGGCPPNFTQSVDDRSCISNEVCLKSLWWVWTVSILGFAGFSLYIVVSCRKHAVGAMSCLVFYFQMSSFATDSGEADAFAAILQYSQVHSLVAFYEGACYAPNMSAYNATAFKLIGPMFLVCFVVAWTFIIQKLQRRLNDDITVTYSGTLAVALLFAFSNIANAVFTLVECTSYSETDAVVFIDGTVPCRDATWNGLVFVAALLFLFPPAFAAALRFNKFPQSARDAVCGKFTEGMPYWGALTLTFRLLIAVSQFLRIDYPNLLAFVRLLLSMTVLVLLVNLRPYVYDRTFWVDVTCHVCLTALFGLQIIATSREFLGVAESLDPTRLNVFSAVTTLSTIFR
jgi:hypothetical protein